MNTEKVREVILAVSGELNIVAHDERIPEDLHFKIESLSEQLTDSLFFLRQSTLESDMERSCETCLHKEKTDQEEPCCYCGGALSEWSPAINSDKIRS